MLRQFGKIIESDSGHEITFKVKSRVKLYLLNDCIPRHNIIKIKTEVWVEFCNLLGFNILFKYE